jgi:hypothetical protein
MAGRKKTYQVVVDERQRQELAAIVASRKSAQSLVQRARIVLVCAAQPAWSDRRVAAEVGCSEGQVRKWRKRWCQTHSLQEAPRSGRPRVFSP